MATGDYSGRTLEGKYRLDDLLGEGGMGMVYSGEHVLIGRRVAVKFLHKELVGNEEVVKRFYREGQAAAAIGHRNIIDVLDVGVSPDGDPFLVMEYLEGEGLGEMLARTGPIDLITACGILEPALLALTAAHEKGIVHRDLKPENIFLVHQAGEPPEVKLIDFGISKISQDGSTKLTQDGSMLGTPAYMSPEQIRGSRDVDPRSDVYAMGVILYELLTNATPFPGEQYHEVLAAVLTEPPVPPEEYNPDFPAVARPVVERALAKDPAERYQSAEEMLAAIKELSSFEERRASMTLLSSGIRRATLASGDLGPAIERGSGAPNAAALLQQVARERSAAGWRRALSRIAARLPRDPRRRYALLGGVGGALLLLIILFATCGGGGAGAVMITIEGIPTGAKVYYDGRLMPSNPFPVVAGEAEVPIKITAKGYQPYKGTLVPSEDQTLEVELERWRRKGAKPKQPESKPPADAPRAKEPAELPPTAEEAAGLGAGTADEGAAEGAGTTAGSKKKKKKKRRFPKLPWQK